VNVGVTLNELNRTIGLIDFLPEVIVATPGANLRLRSVGSLANDRSYIAFLNQNLVRIFPIGKLPTSTRHQHDISALHNSLAKFSIAPRAWPHSYHLRKLRFLSRAIRNDDRAATRIFN